MRHLLSLLGLIVGVAFFGGCANYQLGTEGKLAFRTLYIEPVQNRAQIPQATAVLSTHLRDAFAQDGRVTLVASPSEADAILSVVVTQFRRDFATARPDDTGLARKLNLNLVAQCTLRDNRTKTALFEARAVSAEQQIFNTATPEQTDSQQLQAEYQALPLLARTLADRVAHTALDVW